MEDRREQRRSSAASDVPRHTPTRQRSAGGAPQGTTAGARCSSRNASNNLDGPGVLTSGPWCCSGPGRDTSSGRRADVYKTAPAGVDATTMHSSPPATFTQQPVLHSSIQVLQCSVVWPLPLQVAASQHQQEPGSMAPSTGHWASGACRGGQQHPELPTHSPSESTRVTHHVQAPAAAELAAAGRPTSRPHCAPTCMQPRSVTDALLAAAHRQSTPSAQVHMWL